MPNWLFGKEPRKIYPIHTDPKKGKDFFLDFCVKCGGIHTYQKYDGWKKRNHYPMCNLEMRRALAHKEFLERQTNF